MRRITAAVSAVLLVLVTVAVAEGALLALLLLFGVVLQLNLTVEAGPAFIAAYLRDGEIHPDVTIYNGAVLISIVFTAACGVISAAWNFRRWAAPS
jgi:hypothetical protein